MTYFKPDSDRQNPNPVPNNALLAFLMGDQALTAKEISILCKRKSRRISHGLTSNAIIAYIYLKQYSSNGWYRYFSHADFTEKLGISDRDVYHVLDSLENAKLIRVYGDKYSHFKDIRIYHSGMEKKGRFLSLNRSYFRMGEDDYEKFKNLSAGTKSFLIYILYREKFKKDTFDNVIELNIKEIVHFMGLKKATVIEYIKELQSVWPNLLLIQKTLYGSTSEERLEALMDRRKRYGAVCSKTLNRELSMRENISCGFWRNFELWLKAHGIRERSIIARQLYDPNTHGTDTERIKRNRNMLFNCLRTAAKNGVASLDIFRIFHKYVHRTGFFDEECMAYIMNALAVVKA